MASTSSSLVLGVATGLPPTLIEPFVASLRATGFRGRVALILGRYDDRDLDRFRELADLVMSVDHRYGGPPAAAVRGLRMMRDTRRVRRIYPLAFSWYARAAVERRSQAHWECLEFHLEGLQALRYGLYFEVLRDLAPDADQILVSDLRDVLFQSDPFDQTVHGVEVFLEAEAHTIAANSFNRRWISNLYGSDALESVGAFTASCSGTVVGDREGMLTYLAAMHAAVIWRRRPLGSHDQGIHNWLLRTGQIVPTIVKNGYGRVLTMGGADNVARSADGLVLNSDGTTPAILHQYDRHPELAQELLARLAHGSGLFSSVRSDGSTLRF